MSSVEVGQQGAAAARQRTVSDPSAGLQASFDWKIVVLCCALVVGVVAAYYPVRHFAFAVNIDDNGYVYENPRVLGPLNWSTIQWAFTHSFLLNYDPVTFLGHSINVRLFGLNAGRHHDVNVLLHAVDVLLLFWVLRRSTGLTGRSFMVAALFALHPINVENVAWISELKTMLSTGFFFLALGLYTWYARKPKLARMLVVGFFFGLGLLAKPQVITLPFVLLLWDYWPLRRMFPNPDEPATDAPAVAGLLPRRFSALLIEKIPLFLIAVIDAALTMHAEKKLLPEHYSFSVRLGSAILGYVQYLGKLFWPVNLAFMYPHAGHTLRWTQVAASLVLLSLITFSVFALRKRRYLLAGWLWFLGTMFPMINLVQIDLPSIADRYAYTCFVGLFLMLCWGIADLAQQQHVSPQLLPVASVSVLAVLGVMTHHQTRYWADNMTIWQRSFDVTSHNWLAEFELGRCYADKGETERSLPYMRQALVDRPGDRTLTMNLGLQQALVYRRHQQLPEALAEYQKALSLSTEPKLNAEIYANMGHIYSDLHDGPHALECYRKAQQLQASLPSNK